MTRGRTTVVIVLVVALIAAHFTRDWARSRRIAAAGQRYASTSGGGATLASMNSFALALLLGGLRGPLVMMLWTTSESQKSEKNLEDFDTRVEWIRMLQPEFDTVHIFQVWNKAYNISVQMASLANKYITILDAIEYAENVDRERPENINILTAIAQTYFDKLGNSAEKAYYRKRVRDETLPHKSRQRLDRKDPEWRRLELDARLDERGFILPQYLKPKYERPAGIPDDQPWNTGAELQYVERYQPFPYGLSTFALAYNYHKRATILQTVYGQKHAQLSETVVDSRPALALKNWGEEEWERARRAELRAFDLPIPAERLEMEMPTADLALNETLLDAAAAREALYSYAMTARLAEDAVGEYREHLAKHRVNENTYFAHIDSLNAMKHLALGDRAYLAAMSAQGDERGRLLATAKEEYIQAARNYQLIVLKYYVSDPIIAAVYPKGYGKENIRTLPPEQLEGLLIRTLQAIQRTPTGYDNYAEDRGEYLTYLDRINQRLARLR